MGRYGYIIALFAFAIAIIVGIAYWPAIDSIFTHDYSVEEASQSAAFEMAEVFLAEEQPKEALSIIRRYRKEIESNSDMGRRWLEIFIRASVETLNGPQLMSLYQFNPQAFEGNEKASLIIGDALIVTGRGSEYEELRGKWKGKETLKPEWFILDVDKELLDGSRVEAINLLKRKNFEGSADTSRLIRLALLHLREDPKEAWNYLSEANKKDPQNPEVRSYRGKLLEMVDKPGLALSEYIAAAQMAPDNFFLRDQLAEFYIRQRQYPQAMEIWRESLDEDGNDILWLKTFFWNRVVKPVDYDWAAILPPEGRLRPLLIYLAHLPTWGFWEATEYEEVLNGDKYLNTEQATWWLRLLQAFKSGNEEEAWHLLQFNAFSERVWNPELVLALKKVMVYRKTATFNLEESGMPVSAFERSVEEELSDDSFFKELSLWSAKIAKDKSVKLPADIAALLESKLAYGALFLAAGWDEAALDLQTVKSIPSQMPSWLAPRFTNAIRINRSNQQALEFAALQDKTAEMQLLIGEMMIADNNADGGIDELLILAEKDDSTGIRAAWLISLVYIDRKEYEHAKEIIADNEALEQSEKGRETLARIALLEGDSALADRLYESLATVSVEAKSYLARKAFVQKEWTRARQLTIELLKVYPNSSLLRTNLLKIDEEEKQIPQ